MRARGRRAAGGIRDRAARALDPRRRLLLPRRAQVGSQADRAGLRPRADQAPAVPRDRRIRSRSRPATPSTKARRSRATTGINAASRLIRVTEHYVRMDYEGNDEAALYRVTTGGEEGEVLKRDGEPDVVEVDVIPFAAMTPVIVTHRFFGRSIADLVMDIQRIKTALLRALLDNAYLANNPRTEVPESHATETTLDDLLVSRPGGIVRTKMPGGLSVIAASRYRRPRLPVAAIPGCHARMAHRRVAAGSGRRSQRPAEPGRDHRQPDVQRRAGEDEDDRPHLRRDRHPRPVLAAARDRPQARLAAADSAAAQPMGDGRPARLEGAQRHDHQCRARHRHQDRAARASATWSSAPRRRPSRPGW